MTNAHCARFTSVPTLVISGSLQPWQRGMYQATSELQLGMGRKPLPWSGFRTAVACFAHAHMHAHRSTFPAAGSIALLACTRSCAQTHIPVAFANLVHGMHACTLPTGIVVRRS